MVKIRRWGVVLGVAAVAAVAAVAGTGWPAGAEEAPAPWSYSGATGPAHWGSLDPAYAECADGTAQSPIRITGPVPTPMRNLVFDYVSGEAEVFNNGHTVEAEPAHGSEPSTLTIGGVEYRFAQFHFHAPSEHVVEGTRYPLEIHFVHRAADGTTAVVAVLVRRGPAANAAWQEFIDVIGRATADPAETVVADMDWEGLLPDRRRTIRYEGSLTTPGCREGVQWNVMRRPITMSGDQIAAFRAAYRGNDRPIQPLNGRPVLIDSTARR